MLARVADSIYWMSRYVERAENIARSIDVNYNLALDLGPEMGNHWGPLISTTGDDEEFYARYDLASERNVIWFLTFAISRSGIGSSTIFRISSMRAFSRSSGVEEPLASA